MCLNCNLFEKQRMLMKWTGKLVNKKFKVNKRMKNMRETNSVLRALKLDFVIVCENKTRIVSRRI